MATVGCDQQTVAHTQIPLPFFIGELQAGTAAQHQYPLPFALVVPEALGTAGQAGVNALQSPLLPGDQRFNPLFSGSWACSAQQVRLFLGMGVGAGPGGLRFPSRPLWRQACITPAPADVEAEACGQSHHFMVLAALAQGLAQVGLRLAEGHEGIQLTHLFEELLELGFGHRPSIGCSRLHHS
jgi:hypothetical protein